MDKSEKKKKLKYRLLSPKTHRPSNTAMPPRGTRNGIELLASPVFCLPYRSMAPPAWDFMSVCGRPDTKVLFLEGPTTHKNDM